MTPENSTKKAKKAKKINIRQYAAQQDRFDYLLAIAEYRKEQAAAYGQQQGR